MAALPDRSGRRAAGHGRRRRHRWRLRRDHGGRGARPAGRRGHAPRGRDARLGRLDAQRRDRPPRLQVGPAPARQALRRGDRRGRSTTTRSPRYETVKRLIADESIDCDFREVRLRRARPRRRRTSATSSSCARAWPGAACSRCSSRARSCATRSARTSTTRGLVIPGGGLVHPGRLFAGLAAAADRAGADLHEGVRARTVRRQADGRFTVETERGAILARDVFIATNGYTDGVAPGLRRRIIPIGELHHRHRAAARRPRRRALAARPGVLRHQELPVLLARLGRQADGLRRPGEHAPDDHRQDRADPVRRDDSASIRSSPAGASTTRGAATSASPSTGCRTSGGRPTASPTRSAAAGRAWR